MNGREPDAAGDWITVRQAAAAVGLSQSGFRSLAKREGILVSRRGRRPGVQHSDVLAYLSRSRIAVGTSGVIYRMAALVEGVRLDGARQVSGIKVEPVHEHFARAIPALLNQLFAAADFVTVVDRPSWLAMYLPRHPLLLATTPPGLFSGDAAAVAQIHAIMRTALSMLALQEGGAPRIIGYICERRVDEAWRGVAVGNGGERWVGSDLATVLPSGVSLPRIGPYAGATMPLKVALWLNLHSSISGESDISIRALRFYGLLESIAAGAPRKQPVQELSGRSVSISGKPATTDQKLGKLAYVLIQAWKHLNAPLDMLKANRTADFGAEIEVWKDIRDVIAHDGVWIPSPYKGRLITQHQNIERAALAATPGGSADEGFQRYVTCMAAGAEGVLRALIAGGLKTLVV